MEQFLQKLLLIFCHPSNKTEIENFFGSEIIWATQSFDSIFVEPKKFLLTCSFFQSRKLFFKFNISITKQLLIQKNESDAVKLLESMEQKQIDILLPEIEREKIIMPKNVPHSSNYPVPTDSKAELEKFYQMVEGEKIVIYNHICHDHETGVFKEIYITNFARILLISWPFSQNNFVNTDFGYAKYYELNFWIPNDHIMVLRELTQTDKKISWKNRVALKNQPGQIDVTTLISTLQAIKSLI